MDDKLKDNDSEFDDDYETGHRRKKIRRFNIPRKKLINIISVILLVCVACTGAFFAGRISETATKKKQVSQRKNNNANKVKNKAKKQIKSKKIYSINEPATEGNLKYTITGVSAAQNNNSSGSTPMKTITVQMQIENTGTSSVNYDTSNFKILTNIGLQKSVNTIENTASTTTGSLEAGKSVTVPLVFIVPQDQVRLIMSYEDGNANDNLRFRIDI